MYTKKIYNFSYMRAIACIAVVVLHITYSASILFEAEINAVQNMASKTVTNCMMWAVPVFVMVTGALMLDKDRELSYRKLYKKYIYRILAALITFCMAFRGFDMIMDGEIISVRNFLYGFYEIFTGTSWSHMWYLYMLLGLYLLLPFYRKVVKDSTERELKYLLIVYVLFISLFPLGELGNLKTAFYIHVSTIYPFYLLCGYMLHTGIWRIKKWEAIVLFVLGTVFISIFSIIRWKCNCPNMEMLWGYSSVFVIMQGIGFFAWIDQMRQKEPKLPGKLLLALDRCSFGIYLVHMVFVRLLLRYGRFSPYANGGILGFAGVIAIILIISYISIRLLMQFPFLKKFL